MTVKNRFRMIPAVAATLVAAIGILLAGCPTPVEQTPTPTPVQKEFLGALSIAGPATVEFDSSNHPTLKASYIGADANIVKPTFQWYKGNDKIIGATSEEYTPTEIGVYYVVISAPDYKDMSSGQVTLTPAGIKYGIVITGGGPGSGWTPAGDVLAGTRVTLNPGDRGPGYTFINWTVTAGGITVAADNSFTMPASSVAVTANWEIKQYTVTFEPDNGGDVFYQRDIDHGGLATRPTNPTKTGYGFKGWFLGSASSEFAFGSAQITDSITLVAKWEAIPYAITMANPGNNANIHVGGTPMGTTGVTATVGQVIAIDPGTRDGYPNPVVSIQWAGGSSTSRNFTMPAAVVTVSVSWTGTERTVFFNSDGGTPVDPPFKTVEHGERITKPTPDPTRTGWAFGGWKDSITGIDFNFETTIIRDVFLVAKWTQNPYRVNIQEAGTGASIQVGPRNSPNNALAHYEEWVTLNSGNRANHRFSHWTVTVAPPGFTLDGSSFSMPVGSVTVRANWTPDEHTVTFDLDGDRNAVPSRQVQHGAKATKPADPGKIGYRFLGWFLGAETTAFDFVNREITGSIILVGKWEAISYTVTINGGRSGSSITVNGDIRTGNTTTATVGQRVTLNRGTSATETSNGWTVNAPTGLTFNDGVFDMPASNVTVTANWTTNTYSVTFYVDGGTPVPVETVQHGQPVVRPPNADMKKTGYDFDDWYVSDAPGAAKFNFGAAITSSTHVYARWIGIPYDIEIDDNGGEGSYATAGGDRVTQAIIGTIITLVPGKMDNAELDKWEVLEPTGLNISRNTFVMPAAKVSLKATWTNEYTVTFNTDGGSFVEPQPVLHGGTATQPSLDPTKSGYRFDGWFSDSDKTLPVNWSATLTGSITIYARWVAVPYGISITEPGSDSKISINGTTVTVGHIGDTVLLEPGTKANQIFDGWTVVAPQEGLTIRDDNTFVMPAALVQVQANWKDSGEAKLTITFATLEDLANKAPVAGPTISLGGGGAGEITLVLGDFKATEFKWSFNGRDVPAGSLTQNAEGVTLKIDAAIHGDQIGDHRLTLWMVIDGVEYTKDVTYKVTK